MVLSHVFQEDEQGQEKAKEEETMKHRHGHSLHKSVYYTRTNTQCHASYFVDITQLQLPCTTMPVVTVHTKLPPPPSQLINFEFN